ncbi:hypothetical protein AgCh_001714 [Apium graveolens]
MWNKLIITYEGTMDIKDSRMDTLIQEYENFKLREDETIIDMGTRFTRIIDELAQLRKNPDKPLPKVEEKRKIMALKGILIDEDKNDDELNEELEDLDEQEIALLRRQLSGVLQSKAQRYVKGFLKSDDEKDQTEASTSRQKKEGIGDLLRGKMRKSFGDERTPANNKGGLEIEPKEAINGDNMDDIT